MLGSPIIEMAVGVIFVFLLLSLINSALSEFFAGVRGLRAKHLKLGIQNLLNDSSEGGISDKVMRHPLMASLAPDRGRGGKFPSYIPRETCARVLTAVLHGADAASRVPNLDELREKVKNLEASDDLKRTLLLFIDDANRDVKKFTAAVEKWFDDTMHRVSGWYKRNAQRVVVLSAFIIAYALNVDSIAITQTLYRNPTIRASLADAASAFVADPANIAAVERARLRSLEGEEQPGDPAPDASSEGENQATEAAPDSVVTAALLEMRRLSASLQEATLPFGWSRDALPDSGGAWIVKILGLLITGTATALGAPFWFDVLNKIVNLRGAGRRVATQAASRT